MELCNPGEGFIALGSGPSLSKDVRFWGGSLVWDNVNVHITQQSEHTIGLYNDDNTDLPTTPM